VTITATVAPEYGGTPGGTVTIKVNGTTIGTPTLSGGMTSVTTSATTLNESSNSIEVDYGGDTNFQSSMTTGSQSVSKATTTTTVITTASPNPSVYGQSVMFRATITPEFSGASNARSGTVTFYDGTTQIGSPVNVSTTSGKTTATLSYSGLNFATDANPADIGAKHSGDGNYSGSTSAAITQTVHAATTTLALSSAFTSASTPTVTSTATVSVNSPGSGTPTGTVVFYGGIVLSGTLNGTNMVSVTTTSGLMTGDSVSGTDIPSGTTIDSIDSIAKTITLNHAATGSTTASLTFLQSLGSSTGTSGSGTLTATYTATSSSLAAFQEVEAVYTPDTSNFASTGGVIAQTIITVTVTPSSSTNGMDMTPTIMATVSSGLPGSGTPAGTVTFYVGSISSANAIGTVSLNQSSPDTATLSNHTFQHGSSTYTVYAAYNGTSNFSTSQGNESGLSYTTLKVSDLVPQRPQPAVRGRLSARPQSEPKAEVHGETAGTSPLAIKLGLDVLGKLRNGVAAAVARVGAFGIKVPLRVRPAADPAVDTTKSAGADPMARIAEQGLREDATAVGMTSLFMLALAALIRDDEEKQSRTPVDPDVLTELALGHNEARGKRNGKHRAESR
jgi:hypothetical protein